ncbi:GPI mannosyltransferase 3 protein [Rutstroemia sp. NJR-2017a BVV2]|nr:GPI mannosyltransferase 3 protein [Rutstroemia sp. NJR-2017a BVV2]
MNKSAKPSAPADSANPLSNTRNIQENGRHRLVNEQMSDDIWKVLLVFRLINAFCVRTFFQPDEYFQSLEPAWRMAFGPDSGAWLTWEWRYQLRSSLHPALFAAFYIMIDKPMELLGFFPQFRAEVMVVLPRVVQSVFAAICDYYTWKFAEKLYGVGSRTAWFTFFMTIFSPWQWFCSTRTFSNSLETTLTIVASYHWPWGMAVDSESGSNLKSSDVTSVQAKGVFQTTESVKHLRYSLLLAGIACILRPTNGIIWFCVLMPTIMKLLPGSNSTTSTQSPIQKDYIILIREIVLCGSTVLTISAISDRLYFGEWTFPPYQFLHFNLSQNLAVLYGRNDWHYYLSQGLPLLLTTYLPFTLMSIFKTYKPSTTPNDKFTSNIRLVLTSIVCTNIAVLSLISHKEVRFIYPLLPILHVLTAPAITSFFTTTNSNPESSTKTSITPSQTTTRTPLLIFLLLLNLLISSFTTLSHQSAVHTLPTFLRHRFESEALDLRGVPLTSPDANAYLKHYPGVNQYFAPTNQPIHPFDALGEQPFVGFLMPCHSTAWRSRLAYKEMSAWALGCEPPVGLEGEERERYRDEADRFYDDGLGFLEREVWVGGGGGGGGEVVGKKKWPRYVAGFEGVEEVLREWWGGKGRGEMKEVWREKNSYWHDDSRRRGDVVVWKFE